MISDSIVAGKDKMMIHRIRHWRQGIGRPRQPSKRHDVGMRKRVYLLAYSELNLGDDLFVKLLCERYPATDFWIACPRRLARAWHETPNLHTLMGFSILRFMDRVLKRLHVGCRVSEYVEKTLASHCAAIVSVGGSIFIEQDDWQRAHARYENLIEAGKPLYIVGSNFGPFESPEYQAAYTRLFEKAADVCFRDRYSYELFAELPSVRYAPDIVLSLEPGHSSRADAWLQVAISVMNLRRRRGLDRYAHEYEEKIFEICRHFATHDYQVLIMGFCRYEGDDIIVSDLIERLHNEGVEGVAGYCYNGDITEALWLIEQSIFLVATRFHAIILGWINGKSTFPIVYSAKATSVMRDLNYAGDFARVEDIAFLSPEHCLKALEMGAALPDVAAHARAAKNHFAKLDVLLKSTNSADT